MRNKWMVGVGATLLLAGAGPAASAYTVVFLQPEGSPRGQASGIGGGLQVGSVSAGEFQPALWAGSAASFTNLLPPGFTSGELNDVSSDGTRQVGYVVQTGHGRAALWQGSADTFVNLHGASYSSTEAHGVGGDQQVGFGLMPSDSGPVQHALLWKGTAASVVDLHPDGALISLASGTNGSQQVGFADFPGPFPGTTQRRAMLWKGTAASAVDLTPSGALEATAWAMFGNRQAGDVVIGNTSHAALWSGTPDSFVDLSPTNLVGYGNSQVRAFAGAYQAGFASGNTTDFHVHAMVWRGTSDSALDLHGFLPAGYTASVAAGVDETGNVVGLAFIRGESKAVLWVVPEPATSGVMLSVAAMWAMGRRKREAAKQGSAVRLG